MIPVTYGYARSSKADDATRNLETPAPRPAGFRGVGGSHLRGRDARQLNLTVRLERPDSPDASQLYCRRSLAGPVQPELRRGREDSGGDHQAEHRCRRHQGWHQHRRRQCRGQALPQDELAQGAYRWSPPASDKSGPGPNQGRKEKARTPAGSHTRAGRGMLADVRGDTFDPPSGPHHEGLAGYREAALMLDAVHSVHSMA